MARIARLDLFVARLVTSSRGDALGGALGDAFGAFGFQGDGGGRTGLGARAGRSAGGLCAWKESISRSFSITSSLKE